MLHSRVEYARMNTREIPNPSFFAIKACTIVE
jgi:hypothetical protein